MMTEIKLYGVFVILRFTIAHDDVIKWKHFPRYWPFVRVPSEFPTQRPVTRSCDVFIDLRVNKPLSKQSWGWWFETPVSSLWRHRNEKYSLTEPGFEAWEDVKHSVATAEKRNLMMTS